MDNTTKAASSLVKISKKMDTMDLWHIEIQTQIQVKGSYQRKRRRRERRKVKNIKKKRS